MKRNTTSKNDIAEIQNPTRRLEKDFTCNTKNEKEKEKPKKIRVYL